MASESALAEWTGESPVGGRAGGRVPVERHLRVLPPVPTAYAVAPAPRRRASVGAIPERSSGRVAHGRPAPQVPPLRLTARGRRLVLVLSVLLAMGVAVLVSATAGGRGGELELMDASSVIVEPGDTLWSIARAVAEGRDVREVVHVIRSLNGLDDASIRPGQVLQLP